MSARSDEHGFSGGCGQSAARVQGGSVRVSAGRRARHLALHPVRHASSTASVTRRRSFYELGAQFPHELLFSRTHGGKKRYIYMASPKSKALLDLNAPDTLNVSGCVVYAA